MAVVLLLFLAVQLGRLAPDGSRSPTVVAALPPLATMVQEPAAAPVPASAPEVDFVLPMPPPPPLAAELAVAELPAIDTETVQAEPSERPDRDMGPDREMGIEGLDLADGLVAIEPAAGGLAEEVAGSIREQAEVRALEGDEATTRPPPLPRQREAAVFPPPGRVPAPSGSALVAIIIDDIGPAQSWSARAVAMPGPLTMSFLPYADDLPSQIASAKRHGHEIFLHMPMQPLGTANPGKNALRAGMTAADIRERVNWAIDRVGPAAVGMNNHMGSRMTTDGSAMQVVMDVLRERGLAFVDSKTAPNSVAEGVAAAAGLPHTARDVFLDHFPGTAFVRRQLAELEARARRTGTAVAIGHPLPATMEVLEAWIPAAKARGLRFVKASEMIAARGCDGRGTAGRCGLLHAAGQRQPPGDG